MQTHATLRSLLLTAATLGAAGTALAQTVPSSIELPGARVFPENITSSRDGSVYVGSLGAGGIMRIKPHSTQAEPFIAAGAAGTRSIFGVLADDKSSTLWACSNDLSAMGVNIAGSDSGNWLKGFDLKTGAVKASVKLTGEHTLCNDIAIGPDGAAYVTNTSAPQILRLPAGAKSFEVWSDDAQLAPPAANVPALDGIAFGADGNLYVDTYGPGELFRVDVKDGKAGKVTKLHPSRKLVLADAIRPLGGMAFLIVEGGGRLDRMTVKGDEVSIETLKDGMDVPTGVAIVGKTAWVSEGQLNAVFDPKKKDQPPTLPFHIYSVALSK